MPGDDVTRIRLMTAADLPLAMRLTAQAGWNQVEADWRRFLAMQPEGCFVAELESAAVGTVVTCIFGELAWIAMMLVEPAARGQGVGTSLMEHAIALVDSKGARSVRLDATPLGERLYERLGFVPEYKVARYEGVLEARGECVDQDNRLAVTNAAPENLSRVLALDRAVMGIDRSKFLERLFQERPDAMRVVERSGSVEGYLAVRSGRDALQLGPCVASTAACAALLDDAGQRCAGERVYLDVPIGNAIAVQFAEELRLKVQRMFVRMRRGVSVSEDETRLFASSGPELG